MHVNLKKLEDWSSLPEYKAKKYTSNGSSNSSRSSSSDVETLMRLQMMQNLMQSIYPQRHEVDINIYD